MTVPARAGSTATADGDDGFAEAQGLVAALASTPTEQLAIVVTQHPTLALHTTFALQQCAHRVLDTAGLPQPAHQSAVSTADSLADVLRRLIARGDPSLARRLVPTQASLVDLAIATDASDILARLVDVQTGSRHLVEAAAMVLGKLNEEAAEVYADKVRRGAIVMTSVVTSVPRRLVEAGTSTPKRSAFGHAGKQADAGEQDVQLYLAILADVKKLYDGLTLLTRRHGDSSLISALSAKVCLLDTAWAITERALQTIAPSGSRAHTEELEPLWKALSLPDIQGGAKRLIDAPMALDLAFARPLVAVLRQAARAPRVPILDTFDKTLQSQAAAKTQDDGWAILRSEVLAGKQGQTAGSSSTSDSDVKLEAILAVLPHLAASSAMLKASLSQPPLAGKSTEEIVSILLDRGDEILNSGESPVSPAHQPSDNAYDVLGPRANIFDDEPLEDARIVRGKGKKRETVETNGFGAGLSEELRARILQQAEEPDSDEEAREEWDPFYDASRLEVDLEDAYDGDGGFDAGTAAARGRDSRREDSDDEPEEGEGDGANQGAGHGSLLASQSRNQSRNQSRAQSPDPQAAATKASERILITTMKHKGEQAFSKAARKTPHRQQLLDKLKGVRGSTSVWDDQLIESWATMFARNPRRDKLLAAVDDIMRVGNPNANGKAKAQPSDDEAEPSSPFGPNRGRGGRILRGATTGGNGSGNRGRGGGGRGRGNNRGGVGGQRGGRGQSTRGRGSGAAASRAP